MLAILSNLSAIVNRVSDKMFEHQTINLVIINNGNLTQNVYKLTIIPLPGLLAVRHPVQNLFFGKNIKIGYRFRACIKKQ